MANAIAVIAECVSDRIPKPMINASNSPLLTVSMIDPVSVSPEFSMVSAPVINRPKLKSDPRMIVT